jgi:hypothetical protein
MAGRKVKVSLRVAHSADAKRGHIHKTLRHSRVGGNPVFISRAQALPGHGYCGRAAPSLPSQAEPGTEQFLFLRSGAKQSLPANRDCFVAGACPERSVAKSKGLSQ